MQAKAQKYGIKVLSMEKILADASIEMVVNLTTPTAHYPVIKQLLDGSAIQTARYVVDSGMLGEVTSCYSILTRDGEIFSRAFPFTAKPGGGIGFDVGIYHITALLSILGPIREVSGVVRTKNPERGD